MARRNGLLMHLDGARLWNAVVATGVGLRRRGAAEFDTVSVCFSKGLGAPVGSALAGPREFIARARRVRKLFGGGMRQAGTIAAAALYALDHHIERLAEDHRNAQVIAEAIADTPGLRLDPPEVETNLLWFEVEPSRGTAREVADALRQRGVLVHQRRSAARDARGRAGDARTSTCRRRRPSARSADAIRRGWPAGGAGDRYRMCLPARQEPRPPVAERRSFLRSLRKAQLRNSRFGLRNHTTFVRLAPRPPPAYDSLGRREPTPGALAWPWNRPPGR